MIGSPERFGVCDAERREGVQRAAVIRVGRPRSSSPRRSFTSMPASTVASDATGDGPE